MSSTPVGKPVGLTIAGTDSGGGAGVLADCRTFAAHDLWPAAAITAVTAQNTRGVQRVDLLDPEGVAEQIRSVCSDLAVVAVKTGMLGSAPIAEAVAAELSRVGHGPLVVDPVAVSTSGTALLGPGGLELLRDLLLPMAAVVTPNLAEAAALSGRKVVTRADMEDAARDLVERGCAAVLVTGGHLVGESSDCLVRAGHDPVWLESARVESEATHGTGCVLSAALAAALGQGVELEAACRQAKAFVTATLVGNVMPRRAVSWRA